MTKTPKPTGFALVPRERAAALAQEASKRFDRPGTGSRAIKAGKGREPRWRSTSVLHHDPAYGGRKRIILISVLPDAILMRLKGRKACTTVKLGYGEAFAFASGASAVAGGDPAAADSAKGAKRGAADPRQEEIQFDPPATSKGGQQA